jgi:hypothetical protein
MKDNDGFVKMPQDKMGQLAVLVVHQLNELYGRACCAKCCAPCSVVKDLADSGRLDNVIRMAPAELYEDSAWWIGDGVYLAWLYSRWQCGAHPRCSYADDGDRA